MLKIMRLEERIVLDGAAAAVVAEQAAEHAAADPADAHTDSHKDNSQQQAQSDGHPSEKDDSSAAPQKDGAAPDEQGQGENQKDASEATPPAGGAEETISKDSGSAKETLQQTGVEKDPLQNAQDDSSEQQGESQSLTQRDTQPGEQPAEQKEASDAVGAQEAPQTEAGRDTKNTDGAQDGDNGQQDAAAANNGAAANGHDSSPENQAADHTKDVVSFAYEDDGAARELLRQIQASIDANGMNGGTLIAQDGDSAHNLFSGSGADNDSIFTQQELQGLWQNVGYTADSGGNGAPQGDASGDAHPDNILGVLQGKDGDQKDGAGQEQAVVENNIVDAAAYTALVTPRGKETTNTDELTKMLDAAAQGDGKHVLVIDTSVDDYQQLIDNADPSFEIMLIDGNSDGLQQLANLLEGHDNIDTLAIVTHGDAGEIQLGDSTLNNVNLGASQDVLAEIGTHLSENGDIHFYGCDVASTTDGEVFLSRISAITGADVAGSNDATGSKALGADFDLEYEVGVIEKVAPFSAAAIQAYTHVLDVSEGPNPVQGPGGGDVETGQPPVAGDDTSTTNQNDPVDIDVFANDSDPDGDPIYVVFTDTAGTKGTVTYNGDGTYSYDPNGQFDNLGVGETATDSFTYYISDNRDGFTHATVTITITGPEPEPTPPEEADDGLDSLIPDQIFNTEGEVPPGGIDYGPFDPLRAGPGVIADNVPDIGTVGSGTTVNAGPVIQPTQRVLSGNPIEQGVVAPLLGIETFIGGGDDAAEIISRRIDELFTVDENTRESLKDVNTAVSNALFNNEVTDRAEAIRQAYDQINALVASMTQQEINDTRSILQVWIRALELESNQNGIQLEGMDTLLRQIGVIA